MKIVQLILREGLYFRKINFELRMQFFSAENTQGKTTAIRLLLYSMGFIVPNISGISLHSVQSELYIDNNNISYKIIRQGMNVTLRNLTTGNKWNFDLKNQQLDLHTIIFGELNINVLENILGTFYIDQTRGGIVFNRGDIIGNIHFSVDKLIAGLQGTEITTMLVGIENQKKELKKLRFAKSILLYKKDNNLINSSSEILDNDIKDSLLQIKKLEHDKREQYKQLNNLEKALISNNIFINQIENYSLTVLTDDGLEIPVTKDTLKGFNNIKPIIDAQKSIINTKINQINREIIRLKEETKIDSGLFPIEDYQKQIDESISKIKLDNEIIDDLISRSEYSLKLRQKVMREKIKHNSEVIQYINNELLKYADYLGVKKLVDRDGIKTDNIQTKTGTNGFKLIIAFKIAYIKCIDRFCKIKLPLIIDSLRNNEVSEENAKLIVKILNEALPDHQIVIASIYKYPEVFSKYFEIKDKLINEIDYEQF